MIGKPHPICTHPELPFLDQEAVARNPFTTERRAQSAIFSEVSQSVYLSRLTIVDSKQLKSGKSASNLVSRSFSTGRVASSNGPCQRFHLIPVEACVNAMAEK